MPFHDIDMAQPPPVAENTPEKIFKFSVETMVGVVPYQCREMAFKLGLTGKQIKQFTDLVTRLYHLFVQKDLSMVEVNPLLASGEEANETVKLGLRLIEALLGGRLYEPQTPLS